MNNKHFDLDILNGFVEKAVDEFDSAGFSVSVWDGRQEFHASAGWADKEKSIKASPDSYYAIGSSSKAFAATCIGILADRGMLCLDDKVISHVPEFRMFDPYAAENLTIRDMLCHRCGLPRHDVSLMTGKDCSLEEAVSAIAFLKPAFPFRYRFYYQNHMFALASYLVEKVSGVSFGDFVAENIFRPLGMDSTFAYGDMIPDDDPRKSTPYDVKDGGFCIMPREYGRSYAGAGSIYSTTRDMLKWLRFRLYGDGSVLSDAMRKELQSPQMLIKEGELDSCCFPEFTSSAYGMGWIIESYQGCQIIHHGGALDGYRSGQLFVPGRDIAISVLTNSNAVDGKEAMVFTILDRLLDLPDGDWWRRYREENLKAVETFHKEVEDARAVKDNLPERDELPGGDNPAGSWFQAENFVGTYHDPGYGELCFTERDGELHAFIGDIEVPLIYQGDDRFLISMELWLQNYPAVFLRDDSGIIRAVDITFEPELPDDPIHFERRRRKNDNEWKKSEDV